MESPTQKVSKVGEVVKGITMFLASITGSDYTIIDTVNDKKIEKNLEGIIGEQDSRRIKELEDIYGVRSEERKDYVKKIKEEPANNKEPHISKTTINKVTDIKNKGLEEKVSEERDDR